ncbi:MULTISPECIES: hypothetical protein [Microbacterium]|nr:MULTISPECIES: hypothetical protein [Microbacterium]
MTPAELFLHSDAGLREVVDQIDPRRLLRLRPEGMESARVGDAA